MKKFFLSSAIIISFIFYSLHQRATGGQSEDVIPVGKSSNDNSSSLFLASGNTADQTNISPNTSDNSDNTMGMKGTNSMMGSMMYKDGVYTGDQADAYYGYIQVQATINNGKITDIKFLKYPNDRGTSIAINQYADPKLAQEAISAQSYKVNIISGATDSSKAFIQSLRSALSKAAM